MADRYRDYDRDREGRAGEAWRERDERWRAGERDRPLTERASDEVRSWFGDDEARRRRERDERAEQWRTDRDRGRDEGRLGRDYGEYRAEYGRESGREIGREPYNRPTGSAGSSIDWNRDRGYSGSDLNRERDFGRSDRYANVDEGTRYGQRSFENRSWGPGSEGYRGTSGYETGRGSAAGESWESGPFTGRGPRGYQRGDERIREEICERLTRHGRIDASDIDIRVVNAEVTLSGSVEDREAKRLAEDVAESVFGVKDVNNQIKVSKQEMQPVGTSGRTELGDRPRPGETPGGVLGLAGTANTPELTPPERSERDKERK